MHSLISFSIVERVSLDEKLRPIVFGSFFLSIGSWIARVSSNKKKKKKGNWPWITIEIKITLCRKGKFKWGVLACHYSSAQSLSLWISCMYHHCQIFLSWPPISVKQKLQIKLAFCNIQHQCKPIPSLLIYLNP